MSFSPNEKEDSLKRRICIFACDQRNLNDGLAGRYMKHMAFEFTNTVCIMYVAHDELYISTIVYRASVPSPHDEQHCTLRNSALDVSSIRLRYELQLLIEATFRISCF